MTSREQDQSGFDELLAMGSRVWQLMSDPRVPRWQKAIPILALAYVISPLDLLPDTLPVLTQVDDIAVAIVALRLFLSLAGKRETDLPHGPGRSGSEPEVVDATYRMHRH